jgi:hypothetical protein
MRFGGLWDFELYRWEYLLVFWNFSQTREDFSINFWNDFSK